MDYIKPNTHRRRRRDETRQFRLVGVGGVYWALCYCSTLRQCLFSSFLYLLTYGIGRMSVRTTVTVTAYMFCDNTDDDDDDDWRRTSLMHGINTMSCYVDLSAVHTFFRNRID